MNKEHAMHKAEKVSGELKMQKISGTAKNYEHPQEKAERLCSGGYAGGGKVDYSGDKMKIDCKGED